MQTYLDDFEQMEEDVKTLKEVVNKFLEDTVIPLSNSTRDLPRSIELEVHSLVQKTTDLLNSFSLLEQKIEDVNEAGVNFYSIIGFVNELESIMKEWESKFDEIKDTWSSISNILSQSVTPSEQIEPQDLFTSIIRECDRIQQSLEQAHLKIFVYKKLEPSIKRISNEVSELKAKLQNMMNDWLPKTEQMQSLIEPLMENVTRLTETQQSSNDVEDVFSNLLEKQRNLYEFFARWQLFKKIEPVLQDSLSQLENLEKSFEEALKEWHPANGEIKTLYESVLDKYKKLYSGKTTGSSVSEKYENFRSGFNEFEQEWNLTFKGLFPIVDKWVKRS
ncbi:MAG TPA: hypothetical protein ENL39_06100 [Candidatus Aerophobetes bacterium]|uniref:Uncharacterized protein n=1 Tax=Aerophobetes bacterium TaxID=2030807 RepID=A0A7V5HZZ9_UNCAE|nr:hypothetical protein [Candidatus Aerophobetes bacterium]